MMSLKRIDLLRLIVFIVVFYMPPALLFLDYVRSKAIQSEIKSRQEGLLSVVNLTESLVYAGYESEVCNQLKAEVRAERILLFSFKSPDTFCSIPEGILPASYPSPIERALYTKTGDNEFSYLRSNVGKGTLVVGYEKPKTHSLWFYISHSQGLLSSLFIETLLVLWVLTGFVIIVVSININKIKNVLVGSPLAKNLPIIDKISDLLTTDNILILKEVSAETSRKIHQLEQGLLFSETNLQYSVLKEIRQQFQKGTEPQFPFKFQGVIVRVDINGYGQIMQSTSLDVSREINSTFKNIAAELAYRYSGLFENSAGDEVVYCFRGDHSVYRAVAFVRDLSLDFSEKKFGLEKNISLFVKASLYESEMLMDIGASRVEFDGLSLLYTNRMFGDLLLKNQNVLIIPPELASPISSLVKLGPIQKVHSKGMSLEVIYCTEFYEANQILQKNVHDIFKSDRQLVSLLKVIATKSESSSTAALLQLSKISKVKFVSNEVIDTWIDTVQTLSHDSDFRKSHPHFLPTLVAIGAEVIGSYQWTAACSLVVTEAFQTSDERVSENAIETLVKIGNFEEAASLVNPKDFRGRMKANGLVAHALANPNNENLNLIRKMATAKDTAEMKSGLYAAATVVTAFRKQKDRRAIVLSEYKELLKVLRKSLHKKMDLSDRVLTNIQTALEGEI